jgi:predicted Fe-S protein YdhL (DUF1289 family)
MSAPGSPVSRTGPDGRVASPCISVCRIDDASGLCEGCLRTLDEIAAWSVLDDDDRRAVWAALAARAAGLAAKERSDAR